MRKLFFICLITLGITSCSTEDDVICIDKNTRQEIPCDYYDNSENNGNSNNGTFAESDHLKQVGNITISGNTLTLPIETKGISTNNYRVDVVIYQNGNQLSGGPWILSQSGDNFYRDSFDTTGGNSISGSSEIEVEVYVVETSTSTRDLIDTLPIN